MASSFARDGSPSRGRSTSPRPRIPDENLEASLMDGLPDVLHDLYDYLLL
jgi:division protein 1